MRTYGVLVQQAVEDVSDARYGTLEGQSLDQSQVVVEDSSGNKLLA